MSIFGINHVTLSVDDLEKSFEFFKVVLKLRPLVKSKGKSAYFLAGQDWIALVQSERPDRSERTSYAHLALSVDPKNFKQMAERILQSGAIIWQENRSPGDSLYFLDPSGNKLEIHCGDWKSRIQWLKENPSDEVVVYE